MHGDSVIKQGTEITKGSVINLVLGMGLSSRTTRIPNLLGMGLEEATESIARYYLNMGAVTYDESFQDAEDSSGAFIWRQYPEFDEFRRLNMGMEMDVWLSLDSTLLPGPDSTLFGDDTEIVDE